MNDIINEIHEILDRQDKRLAKIEELVRKDNERTEQLLKELRGIK